jgi:adenosine kinase
MGHATKLSLLILEDEKPELVVISPNDPEAMKNYVVECQQVGFPYLYDPSQQIVRLEASDLQKGIEGALALFVNDYEYALVQKMTWMKAEDILGYVRFMIVTQGEKGTTIFAGDQKHHIPVVKPLSIQDPTGVGDAFRGGFLTAYGKGFRLKICGQMGALAATYCLEQRGPQGHIFTPREFVARFREHFNDEGQLDKLFDGRQTD